MILNKLVKKWPVYKSNKDLKFIIFGNKLLVRKFVKTSEPGYIDNTLKTYIVLTELHILVMS